MIQLLLSPDVAIEELAELRGDHSTMLQKIENLNESVTEGIEETKRNTAAVMALTLPRPSDYGCSEKQLQQILERLMIKRTERQIRRWEAFLKSGGKAGSKPPMDYTLQTRLTLASAATWAESFASRERGRLKTRNRFNELTM